VGDVDIQPGTRPRRLRIAARWRDEAGSPGEARLLRDAADEIDALRRALIEAAGCKRCKGKGSIRYGPAAASWTSACALCLGTGIRPDLSPETQAEAAKAKDAIDG
jgi:hypothetical protein